MTHLDPAAGASTADLGVAVWAADVASVLRASRRVAMIVAGCASVLALTEAVALVSLFPLRQVVSYDLTFDRRSGIINLTMGDGGSQSITTALAKYVIAREGYDTAHPGDGVTDVLAASANGARLSYRSLLTKGQMDQSKLFYNRLTIVNPVVTKVVQTGSGVARVEFTAVRTDGPAARSEIPYFADLRYQIRAGDRQLVVTYYQRNASLFVASSPSGPFE